MRRSSAAGGCVPGRTGAGRRLATPCKGRRSMRLKAGSPCLGRWSRLPLLSRPSGVRRAKGNRAPWQVSSGLGPWYRGKLPGPPRRRRRLLTRPARANGWRGKSPAIAMCRGDTAQQPPSSRSGPAGAPGRKPRSRGCRASGQEPGALEELLRQPPEQATASYRPGACRLTRGTPHARPRAGGKHAPKTSRVRDPPAREAPKKKPRSRGCGVSG